MTIRFLLGPAGSGKTFRCLSEIRAALRADADGSSLILVAPRQATFLLERRLLADESLPGYARLQILSFERLAGFIFNALQRPPPPMLSEEGRVMVLRGLLSKKRDELKLFRASARLAGFAQQLNLVLRELQRHQFTPESLNRLAESLADTEGLPLKLRDFATLLRHYLEWLNDHQLADADSLLDAATAALNADAARRLPPIGGLWLDGFAELAPQELDLLAALVPRCDQATLAFCLDSNPKKSAGISWLSHWSNVRRTFDECSRRMKALPGAAVSVESLPRDSGKTRFRANPALQQLEESWAEPAPAASVAAAGLRLIACADPESEAVSAAREILEFVRAGGRFRETAVLVRSLEEYHEPLQRVFSRYEIPFFLDRRESVSHHPLAELTRSAFRTAALQWAPDDWFAALKSGLVPAGETEIDRLENEALARGWKGAAWLQPIHIPGSPDISERLEAIRRRLVPPFQKFATRLAAEQNRPDGPALAAAVREFWNRLDVESQLQRWSTLPVENAPAPGADRLSAIHRTVWDQMNAWLDNIELAFARDALPLREWLPIIEAGLSNLTVGVVPPALDQVLVGAVDRSRNPELRHAQVLGLNEGVFPAPPGEPGFLTDADREELNRRGAVLGSTLRERAARERYLGYIACTRAAEKLTVSFSRQDANGRPLNPSPFIGQLQRMFPSVALEEFQSQPDWNTALHVNELAPLLVEPAPSSRDGQILSDLLRLPAPARLLENLRRLRQPDLHERIPPDTAAALYGPVLRTSVSRLEEFAACPFRFFIHSGLRAGERLIFELDAREQGTFQHDALKLFHEQLAAEGKRWRDLTPAEARERMGKIAAALATGFRGGLLRDSDQARFSARMLAQSLQDFVEVQVAWMRGQYEFDPVAVELEFGAEARGDEAIDLGDGRKLALQGRIDRIDLWRGPGDGEVLGVIVDYKSGHRSLDAALVRHGVQLQLLAYLNVLRRWPDAHTFGAAQPRPAGAFYVSLHGRPVSEKSRTAALAGSAAARKAAYRHTGRFDAAALPHLDSARIADQFNYRLKQDGGLHANSAEALNRDEFEKLLDQVESLVTEMGRRIYAGEAGVDPYRKGRQTPCEYCDYRSVCRIDPWTHSYRVLTAAEGEE